MRLKQVKQSLVSYKQKKSVKGLDLLCVGHLCTLIVPLETTPNFSQMAKPCPISDPHGPDRHLIKQGIKLIKTAKKIMAFMRSNAEAISSTSHE